MRSGEPILNCQRGFTYLGILVILAISGIAMAMTGEVWQQKMQREREQTLLYVGEAYRQAITSYYMASPGGAKEFPVTIGDLILDKRFPVVRRHLRKAYLDPMIKRQEMGLVRVSNRIVGVYSLSKQKPIRKTGFSEQQKDFENAKTYQDWKFVYSAN